MSQKGTFHIVMRACLHFISRAVEFILADNCWIELRACHHHIESFRDQGAHFTRDIIVGCPCVVSHQKVHVFIERYDIVHLEVHYHSF